MGFPHSSEILFIDNELRVRFNWNVHHWRKLSDFYLLGFCSFYHCSRMRTTKEKENDNLIWKTTIEPKKKTEKRVTLYIYLNVSIHIDDILEIVTESHSSWETWCFFCLSLSNERRIDWWEMSTTRKKERKSNVIREKWSRSIYVEFATLDGN